MEPPSEEAFMGKCWHRYYLLSLLETLPSSTSTSRRRQESSKERSYWLVLMQVPFIFPEPSTYLKPILSSLGSSVASWETPTIEDLVTTALLTHKRTSTNGVMVFWGTDSPHFFRLRAPWSSQWLCQTLPGPLSLTCSSYLIKWKLIHLFCHLKNVIASQTQPPQISTRATFDFLLERRLKVRAN